MDVLNRRYFLTFEKVAIISMSLLSLTACQISYLVKSGYEQARILANRVDNEELLSDPSTPEELKRKLRLAYEAKVFAETELGLSKTKNYTSYVKLDRPYVSYIISAAPKFKLEHYLWKFPLVGSLPYKGFFSEQEAISEAKKMEEEGLDTFVRGTSAYSTLGYFRDPILSSMLRYDDEDLVDTIIHETVHATLYIKSSADFNERLAVFLASKGTQAFYKQREGENSETLKKIQSEDEDEKLFSQFITEESNSLKTWYEMRENQSQENKTRRLREIQERFVKKLTPLMKSKNYANFAKANMNNAYLLSLSTYVADLDDFEKAFELNSKDFKKSIEYFRKLQSSDNPEQALKKLVSSSTNL